MRLQLQVWLQYNTEIMPLDTIFMLFMVLNKYVYKCI